jgi:cold shock CspA family protein
MSSDNQDVSVISGERATGCVKWFNNKAGYGFITMLSGDLEGADIFVHHTSVTIKGSHYKYLVQGEYVECVIHKFKEEDPAAKHEYQAKDVTGIMGKHLMCETHYENRRTPKSSSEVTPSEEM